MRYARYTYICRPFRFRIVRECYQRVKLVLLLLLFSGNVHCRPLEMPPRGHTRPPVDDM